MSYWWEGYPWRYIQTNLREIDMADIDAKQYVEELKKFDATIAMINTSGILASYPTELEFHTQSPYLTGSSLEEIISECHKAGIKVISRTDFSKIRRNVYESHPDWAYRTADGKIVDYNGNIHACVNGGFQKEYALKILEETLRCLDVDGIYFNMAGYITKDYSGNYYGICHCESCRRLFYERFGMDLPNCENKDDPVYQAYLQFKEDTVREHNEMICRFIHNLRPDILINFDIYTKPTGYIREESNTALDRGLPHWQYSASENTKWCKGSYPQMIPSNTSVDFIDFPLRHTAVSPAQQKLRLYQDLAIGGGLDYYLIGRLDNHEDKSGYAAVQEVFHYHKLHENDYTQLESRAAAALIRQDNQEEYRGWYRTLTEGHFLFDVIDSSRIVDLDLTKYNTLILPDVRYLSDEQAAKIDSFAESGGTVLCSGKTGFCFRHYEPRSFPVLKCLGIETFLLSQDARSANFRIDCPELLPMAPISENVAMDGEYIYCEYVHGTQKYCKYVPPQFFGPPEICYPLYRSEYPAFTDFTFGKGRGVYLPWYPGRFLYKQGYQNTWDFLTSVLAYTIFGGRIYGGLSPMVEATLHHEKGTSYDLLQLVNASGHFGVSFFEAPILGETSFRVPFSKEPERITELAGNTDFSYSYDPQAKEIEFRLRRLGAFAAFRMETAD